MSNSVVDHSLLNFPRPWWQPFVSLFLVLYGILALDWNLQPIVFLFWWEVILMTGAALIRVLFALDGKKFSAGLLNRLAILCFGAVISCAMIMLTVTFSFRVFEGEFRPEGFEVMPVQMRILLLSYLSGLILHYFVNSRYRSANPMGELMSTILHILVVVVLLMALAMHLIPALPQLDQVKWVGISVLLVKFIVDGLFTKLPVPLRMVFSAK